jgi:hypothetical protein
MPGQLTAKTAITEIILRPAAPPLTESLDPDLPEIVVTFRIR